jgi:glycosyltransferase involved in cell wall biosynthesis
VIETETTGPQARDGAAIAGSERRLRPRRTDLVTEWPRVSVIIPTLNEEQNLPHVLTKLPGRLHEVIIVDGFSTDDTLDVARRLRPDAKIVLQQCPGKGDALRCGFEAATGDALVMLDADGSANPAEIPAFVETLMAGADFAKGTRFREGGGELRHHPVAADRQPWAQWCRKRSLPHFVLRPLLWLQRLLAALPESNERRLHGLRGGDADQHQDRTRRPRHP